MMDKAKLRQVLRSTWKKTQTLAVRLDVDADTRLDVLCERWGCSRGEVIRRLIRQAS